MGKMRNINTKSIFLFLYVWLCIGFPMGLWVLLAGPSKWLSAYAKSSGMELAQENLYGKLIIVGYVIVSFLFAWLLHAWLKKTSRKVLVRITVSVLGALLLVSVLIFSFRPHWLISYSDSTSDLISQQTENIEFVFGPYPDEAILDSLKEQGFDGVISLLSEMVVPAEPALLKKELEYTKKIDLKVIHIPMLPWVSDNKNSLEKIHQLLAEGKGLYYVHCYLGRDRVNVFKSLVERHGVLTKADHVDAGRRLEEIPQMERGMYYRLEEGVYLTPFPTDEELFSYVLNGYFKTVISLLDSTSSDNVKWMDKERTTMRDYDMNYIHFQCSESFGETDFSELKALVEKQEKPLLMHRFRSDDATSQFIVGQYQNLR